MPLQKPEWFKLDPAKFLSDVQVDAMSTLELGACFRLLCRQWLDGSIPDDIKLLARLCRLDPATMQEAWGSLAPFFPEIKPGKRANRFMWVEREKVIADLERRSDQGTKWARKRWDESRKRATPNAAPNGSPTADPMLDQTRAEQTGAEKTKPSALTNAQAGDDYDPPDPRHAPVRGLIQQLHLDTFRVTCQWDGSEGKALERLLSANPSWTLKQMKAMVCNRFESEDVNSGRPRTWLTDLGAYAAGPLDRFGKLKVGENGRGNKRASPGTGSLDQNYTEGLEQLPDGSFRRKMPVTHSAVKSAIRERNTGGICR